MVAYKVTLRYGGVGFGIFYTKDARYAVQGVGYILNFGTWPITFY